MMVSKLESECLNQLKNSPKIEFESLNNGDNLCREDFMRIWEQLPDVKRAEPINGIVYVPSPLGLDHGLTDHHVVLWLGAYEQATPLCQSASNVTWMMGESVPQPDHFLRLLPEQGGQSRTEGLYPVGAPELAVEVAYSSASYDLHQKLELYRDAGVQEYLVVVLRTREVRWHRLLDNRYQSLEPDSAGVFRSLIFPGLWLNGIALLKGEMSAVLATVQEGLHSPDHAEFIAKLRAK
jgi:Uma2 family endonuclease